MLEDVDEQDEDFEDNDLEAWLEIKAKRDFEKKIGKDMEIVAKDIQYVIVKCSTQFVVQTLRNQVTKDFLKREQLLSLVRTGIRTWHFITNKQL